MNHTWVQYMYSVSNQEPLLLVWIHFNPVMDTQSRTQQSVW